MKSGGRILTEDEVHFNVMRAMALEEKKELRRLGREFEERRVEAKDNCGVGEQGQPVQEMDNIVMKNKTTVTNSLSQTEWLSMEAAMPAEERQTHRNLQTWMLERAKAHGVEKPSEEEEEDDEEEKALIASMGDVVGEDEECDEKEDEAAKASTAAEEKRQKQEEEDKEAVGSVDKSKNWSSVNLAYKESKLTFRGVFSMTSFTNWLWYRCVRPKMEETKSKLPDLDDLAEFGIDDIDELLNEFLPVQKVKKEDKDDKKDKKDKKDDKKDKKDDKKDKKDKKDDKKDKKEKKK